MYTAKQMLLLNKYRSQQLEIEDILDLDPVIIPIWEQQHAGISQRFWDLLAQAIFKRLPQIANGNMHEAVLSDPLRKHLKRYDFPRLLNLNACLDIDICYLIMKRTLPQATVIWSWTMRHKFLEQQRLNAQYKLAQEELYKKYQLDLAQLSEQDKLAKQQLAQQYELDQQQLTADYNNKVLEIETKKQEISQETAQQLELVTEKELENAINYNMVLKATSACKAGNLEPIIAVKQRGLEAWALFCNEYPLTIAIENNHSEVVSYLLKSGVDYTRARLNTMPAFEMALRGEIKNTPAALEIYKAMIAQILQDIPTLSSHGNITWLSDAVRFAPQLINSIIPFEQGLTVAMQLAKDGHVAVLKTIDKDFTIDFTKKDNAHKNIFHYALQNKEPDVSLWLVTKKSFSKELNEYELLLSASQGDLTKVATAINNGVDINCTEAENNSTSLQLAIIFGKQEILKYLLQQPGINISHRNSDGKTALQLAQSQGMTAIVNIISSLAQNQKLLNAAASGNEEALQEALNNGADINSVQENGFNALQLAILHCKHNVIALMIKSGADLNYNGNVAKKDALNLANAHKGLHPENELNSIIEIISKHLKTINNELLNAAAGGNIDALQKSLAIGADINTILDVESGLNAIQLAILFGRFNVIHFMIKVGADLNYNKNKYARNALDLANDHKDSSSNHNEVAKILEQYKKQPNDELLNTTKSKQLLVNETNNLQAIYSKQEIKTIIPLQSKRSINNKELDKLVIEMDIVARHILCSIPHYSSNGDKQRFLSIILEVLKSKPFLINCQIPEHQGLTMAMQLAKDGQFEALVAIDKQFALDLESKDDAGKNILDYAKESNHKDLMPWLQVKMESKVTKSIDTLPFAPEDIEIKSSVELDTPNKLETQNTKEITEIKEPIVEFKNIEETKAEFLSSISKRYIDLMRKSEPRVCIWGGDMELGRIANCLNIKIVVHKNNIENKILITPTTPNSDTREVHLLLTNEKNGVGHYTLLIKQSNDTFVTYNINPNGNCMFDASIQGANYANIQNYVLRASNSSEIADLRNKVCDILTIEVNAAINSGHVDQDLIRERFNTLIHCDESGLEEAKAVLPNCDLRYEALKLRNRQQNQQQQYKGQQINKDILIEPKSDVPKYKTEELSLQDKKQNLVPKSDFQPVNKTIKSSTFDVSPNITNIKAPGNTKTNSKH